MKCLAPWLIPPGSPTKGYKTSSRKTLTPVEEDVILSFLSCRGIMTILPMSLLDCMMRNALVAFTRIYESSKGGDSIPCQTQGFQRERVHNNIHTFSLGHHYDTFSKVTISTRKDVFFGYCIVLIKTTVPAGFKSPCIDLIVFSTQVMTCTTLAATSKPYERDQYPC